MDEVEVLGPRHDAAQPRPFQDGDRRWWEWEEHWCSCWGPRVCFACKEYRSHLLHSDTESLD